MPTALPARVIASLFLGMIAVILMALRIWASPDGYITPDSTQYLAVAESLLADQGLTTPNSGRGALDRSAFAIWPAGYPAGIAMVANLTSTSVFTASKLLNFSVFLSTMLLISAAFGRGGFVLSLILLFGAYLDIFSFTWSEGAFLFLSVLVCVLAGSAHRSPRVGLDIRILALGLTVLGLFLCRYVGAYAAALPALLCLIDLRAKRFGRAGFGALIFLAIIGAMLAYLLNNQTLTGHMTGVDRIPAPESSVELIKQLAIALIREAVLPLSNWHPGSLIDLGVLAVQGAAMGVTVIAFFRLRTSEPSAEPADPLAWVLIFMGAVYFAAIIFLRWRTAFDGFGFRLLAPGSFLIFLGLGQLIITKRPELFRITGGFLSAMCAVSLVILSVQALGQSNRYGTATEVRLANYQTVPEGAILVFANLHARYLRPDLHLAAPNRFSASGLRQDLEPWQAFLDALAADVPVYVEIGTSSDWADIYHPSISAELGERPAGIIIAVR